MVNHIFSSGNQTASRSIRGVGIRTLAAGGAAFLGLSMLPLAHALPPGGAGADTPGTYSSVSPSEVEQCGTLNFEVGGFPAGEIVNIKIDNGVGFGGDASVQGQGVIARQKIGSDGVASGSIEIPCDLTPGDHFLRYLATEGERNLGYTNRGASDFTVVKPQESEEDNSTDSVDESTTTDNSNFESNESTRSGGSRVVTNRGNTRGGNNSGGSQEEVVEEIIYVDEDGQGSGNRNNSRSGHPQSQSQSRSGAAQNSSNSSKKSGLETKAAKPKLSSDKKTSSTKSTKAATSDSSESGIFDKNKDKKKKDESVQAAGASGPNSTPYIGMFVGGAILLVGMTAINAWLLVQRRK